MNCWNYISDICTFSFIFFLAFIIINSMPTDLCIIINLPWIDVHEHASLGTYLMQKMIVFIKYYYLCEFILFFRNMNNSLFEFIVPLLHLNDLLLFLTLSNLKAFLNLAFYIIMMLFKNDNYALWNMIWTISLFFCIYFHCLSHEIALVLPAASHHSFFISVWMALLLCLLSLLL